LLSTSPATACVSTRRCGACPPSGVCELAFREGSRHAAESAQVFEAGVWPECDGRLRVHAYRNRPR
jgi:hypothetical protein